MMVPMVVSPGLAAPRWMTAWSPDEGARRARARLRETLGVDALRVRSAPARLTLVGEFTDFANGLSLPTVMPHRTFIAATPRTDRVVRISTDHASALGLEAPVWEGDLDTLDTLVAAGGWMAHPAGVLWSLQERGYSGPGMDMSVVSCIPVAAGLSSSAALSAATALVANDLWGLALKADITAVELAEVCMDAENEVAGGASAGLGQHVIIRCQPGEALHLDFASPPPTATACPLQFAEYGLGLLIINTGQIRDSRTVVIRERMAQAHAAAVALGVDTLRDLHTMPEGRAMIERLGDPVLRMRARHIYTENERVDLVRDELTGTAPAHERFVAVGKAMYRSHASLETDFEVSNDALNLAVDTAFRVGALGARLVGAGGGGVVIALIRRAQASGAAAQIDAQFREQGLPRPAFAFL